MPAYKEAKETNLKPNVSFWIKRNLKPKHTELTKQG